MKTIKAEGGHVTVICKSKYTYPECCCSVCVLDSRKKAVASCYTGKNGSAVFSVSHSGKYQLIVSAPYFYSPLRQRKWVRLDKDKNYCLYFIFLPLHGSPKCTDFSVRVFDINYTDIVFKGVELNLGI